MLYYFRQNFTLKHTKPLILDQVPIFRCVCIMSLTNLSQVQPLDPANLAKLTLQYPSHISGISQINLMHFLEISFSYLISQAHNKYISDLSQSHYLNKNLTINIMYLKHITYLRHNSNISKVYLRRISYISQKYLGQISEISKVYLKHISGISQTNLQHIKGISHRHISDISQTYLRQISDISQIYITPISDIYETNSRCIYDI